MQHLEVSGAVRHIYIYIYVIRRLKVNRVFNLTFPGVMQPRRGVNHPPHPARKSKKEQSYPSTPSLWLHDLFLGWTLHFYQYSVRIQAPSFQEWGYIYIMCDQKRKALCGRRVDFYTLDCKSVTVHRNKRYYMKHTEICEVLYQATANPNVINSAVDV